MKTRPAVPRLLRSDASTTGPASSAIDSAAGNVYQWFVKCIVTAGPTFEELDEVRRLTNASTGRLGIGLAEYLTAQGHAVTLLVGEHSTWAGERKAGHMRTFTTSEVLLKHVSSLASQSVDAVFHAAAVGDFSFGRIFKREGPSRLRELRSRKIPTQTKHLLAELVPTTKVISHLRRLFPKARIVGWKFEVDGDRQSALAKGRKQIAENQIDACVVNGPAYGRGFGLVSDAGHSRPIGSRERLYAVLNAFIVR